MPFSPDPGPTFEAFDWAQAFSSHMRDLGASIGSGELFELGRQLYAEYRELDPDAVAERVWANWPPGSA